MESVPITHDEISRALQREYDRAVHDGMSRTATLLRYHFGLDNLDVTQMALLALIDALRKDDVL